MTRSFAIRKLLATAVLMLSTSLVFAQRLDSTIQKINAALLSNSSADLYLQVDKSLFQTGEQVWFAGYVLNNKLSLSHFHTLHVLLVNDMQQRVVDEQHFVINNGLCGGTINLPDTLQTGQYSLIAYTNLFAKRPSHESYFRQSLEVVGRKPLFQLSFSDTVTTRRSTDSIKLLAKIIRTSGGLPVGASIHYTLYADGIQVQAQTKKINPFGEISLIIPPSLATQNLELVGSVVEGKEACYFKQPLLWESKQNVIRFFTAGGHLVANDPGKVFVQITTTSGKGLSGRLQLLEDGQPIGTFTSDIYGQGNIDLTPKKDRHYSVALEGESTEPIQHFPTIIEGGYKVQIIHPEAGQDSLVAFIAAQPVQKNCLLTIENGKTILAQQTLNTKGGTEKITFATKGWHRGLCRLLLHDENGTLLLKQAFTLTPDTTQQVVTLTTDSALYHQRSIVKVHISIKDKEGRPLRAVSSFSAVASKTVTNKYPDIVRFQAFERTLPPVAMLPSLSYLQQNSLLEYWLASSTSAVYNEHSSDWKKSYTPSAFDGRVTRRNGGKLKQPVSLSFADAGPTKLTTDAEGYFILPQEALKRKIGETVVLRVADENAASFELSIDSSEKKLHALLAAQYYCLPLNPMQDFATIVQKEEMQRAKAAILEGVVVTSTRGIGQGSGAQSGRGSCEAGVCGEGVLFCTQHPAVQKARVGARYKDVRGRKVIYGGCYSLTHEEPQDEQAMQPIYYAEEFPVIDLRKVDYIVSPDIALATTLYWTSVVVTNENGEADLLFYTGDLKGSFTCLLQGVGAKGVLQGKATFTVGQ